MRSKSVLFSCSLKGTSSNPPQCQPTRATWVRHSSTISPCICPWCPCFFQVHPVWMLPLQWCSQANCHGNREPRQTKPASQQPQRGLGRRWTIFITAAFRLHPRAYNYTKNRDKARKPHPRVSWTCCALPWSAEG